MGKIVAAFGVPHAPQLLVRPPTEEEKMVEQTHRNFGKFKKWLDESNPDAIIIVGDDHFECFSLKVLPQICVCVAEEVNGGFFNYDKYHRVFKGASKLAQAILEDTLAAGFETAFSQETLLGHEFTVPLYFMMPDNRYPIVPIVVNSYVYPQPLPRRCYEFGQVIAKTVEKGDQRVALIGSGGMSHYPATPKYPYPDFESDKRILEFLQKPGGAKVMAQWSVQKLDEEGNLELLPWMLIMGTVGDGPAIVLEYVPMWHHGYGFVYWEF